MFPQVAYKKTAIVFLISNCWNCATSGDTNCYTFSKWTKHWVKQDRGPYLIISANRQRNTKCSHPELTLCKCTFALSTNKNLQCSVVQYLFSLFKGHSIQTVRCAYIGGSMVGERQRRQSVHRPRTTYMSLREDEQCCKLRLSRQAVTDICNLLSDDLEMPAVPMHSRLLSKLLMRCISLQVTSRSSIWSMSA